MQSVPFRVDKVALASLLDNFRKILFLDLKDVFGNDDYLIVFDNFDILPFSKVKSNNQALVGNKQSDQKILCIYLKVMSTISKFCQTIFLAAVFSEYEFYFPHFIDPRGRIYSAISHPLNPQGFCSARFLLTLGLPSSLPQKSTLYGEEYLTSSEVEGFDVSCSGAQILGGLSNDISVLLATNFMVLKTSAEDVSSKQSIYTHTLAAIRTRLDTYKYPVQNPLFKTQVLNVFNRDFIKGWVLRYLYSEGVISHVQNN